MGATLLSYRCAHAVHWCTCVVRCDAADVLVVRVNLSISQRNQAHNIHALKDIYHNMMARRTPGTDSGVVVWVSGHPPEIVKFSL